jgi:Uma2 family endonuclease
MLPTKRVDPFLPPVTIPKIDLPTEDGIPLETNWHRIQMNLLIDSVHYLWRDRTDFFVGGNMFIYFSFEQARNRDYRGPDFFVVKGVDGTRDREAWIVWEEDGRYPNVIIELSSPSTLEVDLVTKRELYEQTFRTPEYFCYNPDGNKLIGWRLANGRYVELEPNDEGRLRCNELGVWLGNWEGEILRVNTTWLRFFTDDGELVPTLAEAEAQRAEREAWRAKLEARRADVEARRAEKAEKELARLRQLLAEHGISEPADSTD